MTVDFTYKNAKICRTCESDQQLTNLTLDSSKSVLKKLRACADIEIDLNDDLPKELCKACSISLDLSYKFKIKCEFTDQRLRDILSEMKSHSDSHQSTDYVEEHFIIEEIGEDVTATVECKEERLHLPAAQQRDFEETIEFVDDEEQKRDIFVLPNDECQKTTDYVCFDEQSNADALLLQSSEERLLDEHDSDGSVNDEEHIEDENEHDDDNVQLNFDTLIVEEPDEYDEDEIIESVKEEGEENIIEIQLGNYTEDEPNPEETEKSFSEVDEMTSDDEKRMCKESSASEEPCVSSTTPTQQRNKLFVCDTCDASFIVFSEFNAHKRSHGKQRYQCPICNRWFSKRYHLKNHQVVHETHKQFKCNKCDKSYTNQGNLDRHVRVFHNKEKAYGCDFCGKGFSQSTILRQHYAVHMQERNYQCDTCHKFYKTPEYLNLHKMRHLPMEQRPPAAKRRNRKYKPQKQVCYCTYCGKQSNTIALHQSHLRTHTGEKPFECFECKKRFSFQQSLKSHILLHTGERPYKCDVCDLKFRQIGHLQGHKLTHTGQKQHHCTVCKKSFSLRGNLTVHMRLHTGETPYHCTLCDKQFYDSNGLKRHLVVHTRMKQELKPLAVKPSETYELSSFECNYCTQLFDDISTFKEHLKHHKQMADEEFTKSLELFDPNGVDESEELPTVAQIEEPEIYYIQT